MPMLPVAKKKGPSANVLLATGLGACVGLIAGALFFLHGANQRRQVNEALPPSSAAPAKDPMAIAPSPSSAQMRYKPAYYQAVVEEDAKRFGIAKPSDEELRQSFRYSEEIPVRAPHRMKAEKDTYETPHLRLSTHMVKEWALSSSGQGFRFEHTVLDITNYSDHPVAYRVETSVDHPEKCHSKGAIGQNAIALLPGETISRTECLWHTGAEVTLQRVEVLEVPRLGYYYASRLTPSQVLGDTRTSAGHQPPAKAGKPCTFVPWREIEQGVLAGKLEWADVMDFYSRHNCDEYSFWIGYKRSIEPRDVPASPMEATATR